jgi:anti-sigma B factor antagonist
MTTGPKGTDHPWRVAKDLMKPAARATVLELKGSFDVFEQDELNTAFYGVASDPFVVIDLSSVTHVDSTILAEIVRLQRLMTAESGRLVFVGASSKIHRLLSITGLDRVLDIRTSLADVERDHTLTNAKRIKIETD